MFHHEHDTTNRVAAGPHEGNSPFSENDQVQEASVHVPAPVIQFKDSLLTMVEICE